jgi:hypothetical protein
VSVEAALEELDGHDTGAEVDGAIDEQSALVDGEIDGDSDGPAGDE